MGANVIEVTQSVLQDMFAMIMLVDITGMNKDFAEMVDRMNALGSELGLSIHTMHEDIFNSMHSV
ncbi:MAG TPA: ACT domain-containing protein, partial [Ruminococcus sp.]|nr:ACT domain-containing protein [Ruminococcus sp.]